MTLKEQISGHTTVQASAGSGKTYLLISRVVRLLLTGAESGNILAITFTRKAANEMQTRLLERLYELATCSDENLKEILLELQLDSSPALITLSRGLYEKILHNESPVKSSTFHAFCQELLRRFPMEANISPGFDLLDKTSQLYDEAWDALMAEANCKTNTALISSLQLLFKELGLYNSKQALTNFLEHRSDWWAYTDSTDDPALYAKQNLEAQLNINPSSEPIEELFDDSENILLLNEFHILLCKHETKKNVEHSDLIYKIIDDKVDLNIRFKFFKECFLTQSGEARKRKESKTQEKSMTADGQVRFLELHTQLSNTLIHTNSQLSAIRTMKISNAWYIAGHQYLEYFQKLKKEQRSLDFNDLEWQTYLLLNKSNNALWVQYKLDQRIEHLLVDEFQDTNPTQWRLILPLLEEMAASEDDRQRSVFIVGDAKQSIYRFRRAEPRLFTAAEEWLKTHLDANTCTLSHSWRSSPAIIDFINHVFTQDKFKALLPSFIEHNTHKLSLSGKVTLLPLSMKEWADKEEPPTPILRNPLDQPREESISQQYFNEGILIAEEIQTLIKNKIAIDTKNGNKAVSYSDIIILIRSRTHAADYERALRQQGIPYIGANKGTLLESLEVNDMLDLLQWLILPFDNLSLAGILRSPLFSVTNEDLIEIQRASKGSWLERLEQFVIQNPQHNVLNRAHKLLSQWQEDANKLPAHDLLDKIYSQANVLARYVAAFPPHLSQRVSANLTRFLELALEMDSGRYPSLSRFSSWLGELKQMENEAPDEPVSPASEGSEQRVQILSVHAAKGLEAPIIFLADSANSPSNKKAYSTLIDWPAEEDKPDYFLLTSAKINLDEFSKQCLKEQELLEQRENANLLYVALTRAKQMLYISGSEPNTKDHGWYEQICTAFDTSSTKNKEATILNEKGDFDIAESKITNKNTTRLPVPKELSAPITIDYSLDDISPSQKVSTTNNNDDATESNTLRGTVMHQMMNYLSRSQKVKLTSFFSTESNNIQTSLLQLWWKECSLTVKNESHKKYFDSSCYEKFYNEVPIQFKDEGSMVYGIVDRIIIKGNTVTIIDYKTHPYINSENISETALHYEQQMNLYKKGAQLLWPEHNIESVLLFTANSTEYAF